MSDTHHSLSHAAPWSNRATNLEMHLRLEDQGTQQGSPAPKWNRPFDRSQAFLHCSVYSVNTLLRYIQIVKLNNIIGVTDSTNW